MDNEDDYRHTNNQQNKTKYKLKLPNALFLILQFLYQKPKCYDGLLVYQ